MSDEMLVANYLGETEVIDKFVDSIVLSDDFLRKYTLYPKLLEEAREYVEKGVLTEDEKILSDYASKTRAVKAFSIQVESISGQIMQCFNRVDAKGEIIIEMGFQHKISFMDVKKVTYNQAVIYEKNEM